MVILPSISSNRISKSLVHSFLQEDKSLKPTRLIKTASSQQVFLIISRDFWKIYCEELFNKICSVIRNISIDYFPEISNLMKVMHMRGKLRPLAIQFQFIFENG